jgi:hypothetical protein
MACDASFTLQESPRYSRSIVEISGFIPPPFIPGQSDGMKDRGKVLVDCAYGAGKFSSVHGIAIGRSGGPDEDFRMGCFLWPLERAPASSRDGARLLF